MLNKKMAKSFTPGVQGCNPSLLPFSMRIKKVIDFIYILSLKGEFSRIEKHLS